MCCKHWSNPQSDLGVRLWQDLCEFPLSDLCVCTSSIRSPLRWHAHCTSSCVFRCIVPNLNLQIGWKFRNIEEKKIENFVCTDQWSSEAVKQSAGLDGKKEERECKLQSGCWGHQPTIQPTKHTCHLPLSSLPLVIYQRLLQFATISAKGVKLQRGWSRGHHLSRLLQAVASPAYIHFTHY